MTMITKDNTMIIHKDGARVYLTEAEVTDIATLMVDLAEELKVDISVVPALLRACLANLRHSRDAINSVDRRAYAEFAMQALGWKP